MNRFVKDEKGTMLALTAISGVVIVLFASMAIDVSCILTARNQLQSGIDASALAGAIGLLTDTSESINRAIAIGGQNTCLNEQINIGPNNIDFPTSSRVRVQANRNVDLFFARIIGIHSVNISALAVAELGTIIGTNRMRPWALPDLGLVHGMQVVLKAGSLGAPATNPSFFYPIDFPPLNVGQPISGGDVYRDNIIYGSPYNVSIGDELQVEPGNMIGPTKQGIQDLINMDPDAYWSGSGIQNSAYPGTSSPRVIKIPLYNPNDPPNSGRNSITVVGLASFFVVGLNGNNVMGIFMSKITNGIFGTGNSLLMGTRLIM